MRQRTDGNTECGFSELSVDQKRFALASLPQTQTLLSACPFCQGRMKPELHAGRQACRQCKVTSYPPPWRNDAHKLIWHVDTEGNVLGFDGEIRF